MTMMSAANEIYFNLFFVDVASEALSLNSNNAYEQQLDF